MDKQKLSKAAQEKYGKPNPYRGVIARFPRAILEVAKVSGWGTQKHERPLDDNSYATIPDARFMFAEAELRHMLYEAIHGPINTQDANMRHKAQKAWDALADLEIALRASGEYDAPPTAQPEEKDQ